MRRFNYTGRSKLTRDCAAIHLFATEDGTMQFEPRIDLSKFKAEHPAAQLVVEAYVGTRTERFELGAVQGPDLSRRTLSQFGPDEPVLFRVKVVDNADDVGRLIGLAKQVKPVGPAAVNYSSLLPVVLE